MSPSQGFDRTDSTIKRYKNHPNIKSIKRKRSGVCSVFSQPNATNNIRKIIRELKNNKAVGEEILVHILKESKCIFETLTNCINK